MAEINGCTAARCKPNGTGDKPFDVPGDKTTQAASGRLFVCFLSPQTAKNALKKTGAKIYLETNGTLTKALKNVLEYIDIISMDFKIDSSAKIGDIYSSHDEFLKTAKEAQKEVFAKLVFDENIKDYEINECVSLAKKYDIPLILQPKMNGNNISVSQDKILKIFETFTEKYHDVRMIGQVHKFFDIK